MRCSGGVAARDRQRLEHVGTGRSREGTLLRSSRVRSRVARPRRTGSPRGAHLPIVRVREPRSGSWRVANVRDERTTETWPSSFVRRLLLGGCVRGFSGKEAVSSTVEQYTSLFLGKKRWSSTVESGQSLSLHPRCNRQTGQPQRKVVRRLGTTSTLSVSPQASMLDRAPTQVSSVRASARPLPSQRPRPAHYDLGLRIDGRAPQEHPDVKLLKFPARDV